MVFCSFSLLVPVGNGGKTDKYVWTQTLQQVEVMIELPKDIPGKLVKVEIEANHVSVKVKGETLIDGQPHAKIDVNNGKQDHMPTNSLFDSCNRIVI